MTDTYSPRHQKTPAELLEPPVRLVSSPPALCSFCELAIRAPSVAISGPWYRDETDLSEYVYAAADSKHAEINNGEKQGNRTFLRDEAMITAETRERMKIVTKDVSSDDTVARLLKCAMKGGSVVRILNMMKSPRRYNHLPSNQCFSTASLRLLECLAACVLGHRCHKRFYFFIGFLLKPS